MKILHFFLLCIVTLFPFSALCIVSDLYSEFCMLSIPYTLYSDVCCTLFSVTTYLFCLSINKLKFRNLVLGLDVPYMHALVIDWARRNQT